MLTSLKGASVRPGLSIGNYAKTDGFKIETALAFITALGMDVGLFDSVGSNPKFNEIWLKKFLIDKAKYYVSRYPAPFEMRSNLFSKLDISTFNPTKRERLNQLWDEQVLHLINQKFNNEDIVVVTSDKGMMSAVANIKTTPTNAFNSVILTLDNYLNHIGIK